MDCMLINNEEFAERYLRGKLAQGDRDAYERHYFECDHCFRELQQLLAIQKELESQPVKAPAPRSARRTAALWWRWPALAAAATLVTVMILVPRHDAVAPVPSADTGLYPMPTLAELARVDPPRYEMRVLRGMHDAATTAFREGMKAYAVGDYNAAAERLLEAATADASRSDVAFYLGVSQLLAGRSDAAEAEFERLIGMGETAFTEEAHFYLGKALLRQERLTDAARAFQRVAEMDGALQAEAKFLLEALAGLEWTSEVH